RGCGLKYRLKEQLLVCASVAIEVDIQQDVRHLTAAAIVRSISAIAELRKGAEQGVITAGRTEFRRASTIAADHQVSAAGAQRRRAGAINEFSSGRVRRIAAVRRVQQPATGRAGRYFDRRGIRMSQSR